jgi:hypothetical protein
MSAAQRWPVSEPLFEFVRSATWENGGFVDWHSLIWQNQTEAWGPL